MTRQRAYLSPLVRRFVFLRIRLYRSVGVPLPRKLTAYVPEDAFDARGPRRLVERIARRFGVRS